MENLGMRGLPLTKDAGAVVKRVYAVVLAVLLVIAGYFAQPHHEGDILEYAAMATALAAHGTPDIRHPDVVRARQLAPVPALSPHFDAMERNMRDPNLLHPVLGFQRAADGNIYSIHFFTYSAFAAVAATALGALGLPLEYAFISVNLAAVFVLGMAMYRLLGTPWRAAVGMMLFLACGGVLYWNWSSPELATAACLLAGLSFFATGAPVAGGLLAGLAATQNPPLVFFAFFGPLFYILLNYRAGSGWREAVLLALTRPGVYAGGILCVALALAPPLFSMAKFGVPSLIAQYSTLPELIGIPRLLSFYFDPNQGMIVAVPALLVALFVCGWRAHGRGENLRHVLLLAAAVAFTLALALPALSATNWNSAAQGVMRYGFWAAMPLVFVFLLYLRCSSRWPIEAAALVLSLQALAMLNAASYSTGYFSPAGEWLLRNAPGWYHPDPEVFTERVQHRETGMDPDKTVVFEVDGKPVKTLINAKGKGIQQLCGANSTIANPTVRAGYGAWRYFEAGARCTNSASLSAEQLVQRGLLGQGWSALEKGGGDWDGVWSDGAVSRITLHPEQPLATPMLTFHGHYFDGNAMTRITVNGQDLGWHALDGGEPIELPALSKSVEIKLEHEQPGGLAPPAGDNRKIAYFLRRVELR